MHPATTELLRFFRYDHLPQDLQIISKRFHDLANELALSGSGPEVTAGLRKLLEAKDCFVRANLIQKGM
jgi:hypothetical protein